VELRLGGAVDGVGGFGVLVIQALLEAAADSCKDRCGCCVLRWLSAGGRVVRRVGSAARTVDLEEHYGMEETPGWL